MNTKYNIHHAKALLCFCLFLTTACLTAQNTGSYKYIVNSEGITHNTDILEINNRYYLLSEVHSKLGFTLDRNAISFVTIFDTDLNQIEQIPLPEIGSGFFPMKFFYKDNYFYIFGYTFVIEQTFKPCYAKLDKDFNLVQEVSVYKMDDNLSYEYFEGVLMTEEHGFVFLLNQEGDKSRSLLHINNSGEVLQEVILPSGDYSGTLVETDSFYIMNFTRIEFSLVFWKNSLEKYEWMPIEREPSELSDGRAIVVNNQLITTNSYHGGDCKEDIGIEIDSDISIKFLNKDFSLKNRLIVGRYCRGDNLGRMHYLNPDSIYFAYQTSKGYAKGNDISIANFSSEGELNFDYTLDIPRPVDSLYYKSIINVKAISNGGVLVTGTVLDYSNEDSLKIHGFLLLYHPTREDLGEKNQLRITNYELRAYPNPTKNQLQITNCELRNGAAEYSIYSVAGQKVMHGTLQDETTVINIASLAKGMYYLRVAEKTVRFVKE